MQSFDDVVAAIERHSEVVLLADDAGARVAVSSALQGRVMASAPNKAQTIAFINEKAIENPDSDAAFNNYGGEDRFWLGPEAGQFGLWFKAGDTFDMQHWSTPPAIHTGAFKVMSKTAHTVTMARHMEIENYSNTKLAVDVERVISIIPPDRLGEALGCRLSAEAGYVGFESDNRITNAAAERMTRKKGLLSIWILGQFMPSDKAVVIIPFVPDAKGGKGPAVNDRYFSPVPPKRLKQQDDYVLFLTDGKFRAKIGVSAARARDRLAGMDFQNNVLTIVRFDLPAEALAKAGQYVNSWWEMQDDPFAGDVVNSYNDGPSAPGQPSLGGFYELETSSPAMELDPGQTLRHRHRTFHFYGPLDALRSVGKAALGVDLSEVKALMGF